MSVLGRLLVSSAERIDLVDFNSIDSYTAGDFQFLIQSLVGSTTPYILQGFDIIDPTTAIGTQSCSVTVANSVVYYPGSSAGPFFYGLPVGNPMSAPLVPNLRQNATNFIYLTLTTADTSSDTRAFFDADENGGTGGEFTQNVNTESVLQCQINVSVSGFPANTVPVAIVTVGSVVITAIEDCRNLMFRLGTGGISPNPTNTWNWRQLPNSSFAREEPPVTMTAGGVNPFQGGDKNLYTLKEWMDAVMTKLRELGGTNFWYEDTSTYSLISFFVDALASTFKSKGQWVHDATTPGLITWTEDIQIKMTSDLRTYITRNGNVTLSNEQVAFLSLVRNQPINSSNEAVIWTNGQNYVNTSTGGIGQFQNLSQGDWIKKSGDPRQYFLRVEEFYDTINLGGSVTTAASAKSIRLSDNYLGVSSTDFGFYDQGVYQNSDVHVTNRSDASIITAGGNFHWLAIRSDTIENVADAVTTSLTINITGHNGVTATVTSGSAHGLISGDYVTIAGSVNFNGTYKVDVESTTVFTIQKTGGPFGNETGVNAYYAVITTSAYSTPYGLQLESADHGFQTDDTIIISNTTNYNGSFSISVRSATTFNIAVASALATETAGLATKAIIILHAEQGVFTLIQGESGDIGGDFAQNVQSFLGMTSQSQTYPDYATPVSYNALNGYENFNSGSTDNVTLRLSELTAMMADKAQDKTIQVLPQGITDVTNTTSGSAQQIVFNSGATLIISQPGSPGNATVTLPSSSPGISLTANQIAYVEINRNSATTPSIQIASATTLAVDENMYVIASRITGSDCYLWDGTRMVASLDNVLFSSQDANLIRENKTGFFRSDDLVSWDGSNFTFAANIVLELINISGTLQSYTIASSNSPLAISNGQYVYITIDRTQNTQTVTPTISSSIPTQPAPGTDIVIFAKCITAVGSSYLHIPFHKQLISPGQSVRLGATGGSSGSVVATYLDPISTVLPTGSTLTVDGISASNGDTILYTNLGSDNNEIYELSGVGTSIVLTAQKAFNGSLTPVITNSVIIASGLAFAEQTAIFNGTNFLVNDVIRQFDGVSGDFWEQSSIKTMTLADNTTAATVFTVAYAGSQNMAINYSIIRNSIKNSGELYITTNGTVADIARVAVYTGDVGVSFSASISGSNIILSYTTTSTGNAATLKYFVKRWSDTSGGPTGIPSYSGGPSSSIPAAGSTNDVQYNSGGVLAADARFQWDGTNGALNLNGYEISALSSSIVLNDNQSSASTIITYAAATYPFAIFRYSAIRGSDRRMGTLMVMNDGTNTEYNDDYMELSIMGLTLSATISGGNVIVQYITTSTGSAGTFKYHIEGWS